MKSTTVEVLLDRGIIRSDDILEVARGTLVAETAVSRDAVESEDFEDEFWQCEVTDRTKETNEVRYRYDETHYGLGTITNRIVDRLTDRLIYTSISSPETYWCHPDFNHRTLWDLRMSNISREDRSSRSFQT